MTKCVTSNRTQLQNLHFTCGLDYGTDDIGSLTDIQEGFIPVYVAEVKSACLSEHTPPRSIIFEESRFNRRGVEISLAVIDGQILLRKRLREAISLD